MSIYKVFTNGSRYGNDAYLTDSHRLSKKQIQKLRYGVPDVSRELRMLPRFGGGLLLGLFLVILCGNFASEYEDPASAGATGWLLLATFIGIATVIGFVGIFIEGRPLKVLKSLRLSMAKPQSTVVTLDDIRWRTLERSLTKAENEPRFRKAIDSNSSSDNTAIDAIISDYVKKTEDLAKWYMQTNPQLPDDKRDRIKVLIERNAQRATNSIVELFEAEDNKVELAAIDEQQQIEMALAQKEIEEEFALEAILPSIEMAIQDAELDLVDDPHRS